MVFLSQKLDGNMIFTDYWKVLVLIFSRMGNRVFSWVKKLIERWHLLITEKLLFWTFLWWEIRSFFESRNWWKDNIYWLLRSSCFEIFGDGKYGLFSAKMLMERLYLHGLFELSKIFQDLGNMVFRAVDITPLNKKLKEDMWFKDSNYWQWYNSFSTISLFHINTTVG